MCYETETSIKAQLDELAQFFASKTADNICFADADTADYKFYTLYKEWSEKYSESFSKRFPYIERMWRILSTWNFDEGKTLNERQQIIEFAQKHLQSKGLSL